MIYVCVPVHNEASTVGLVLWKVRQVFTAFEREYQIIACDDASTDGTADVLTSYARVLPLTVIKHQTRQGYARSLEELLRLALQRTDRPKRDCAITLHADFVHSPESMEDMVKHLESGASLSGPGVGAPLDASTAARRRAARHGVGVPRPAADRTAAGAAARHAAVPPDRGLVRECGAGRAAGAARPPAGRHPGGGAVRPGAAPVARQTVAPAARSLARPLGHPRGPHRPGPAPDFSRAARAV